MQPTSKKKYEENYCVEFNVQKCQDSRLRIQLSITLKSTHMKLLEVEHHEYGDFKENLEFLVA